MVDGSGTVTGIGTSFDDDLPPPVDPTLLIESQWLPPLIRKAYIMPNGDISICNNLPTGAYCGFVKKSDTFSA